MMNEKQIYRRMNEAYKTFYGEEVLDEWYGTNSPKEWKFNRPSKRITVRLIMDEESKKIFIEEKKFDEDEYRKVSIYEW